MNFKQTVQISVVALGFVAQGLSPHIYAGPTGFETGTEVVTSTTEISRVVVPDGGTDVGISSRDGITFSAPDVLITRNGVTERLTRSITLPNGTRVMPNGTVILAGGARVWLRPEQIVALNGELLNAPIMVAATENTDAIIDASRTAAVETAIGVVRARPAARRLSTRPQVETTTQTVIPIQPGAATVVPVPTSTPQYVDPEIQFLLGQ